MKLSRLPLIAIAIASISFTNTSFALDCTPNTCDAGCQQEWDQNKQVIANKAMRWMTARYSDLCGHMPDPDDRNDCYEKNLAHEYGITDGNFEPILFKTYINSNWNPTFVACTDQRRNKAKADRSRSDASDALKQKEQQAKIREAEQAKEELQAQYQHEEEARLQAQRQQREIQVALHAQQTDMLNQQAELQFRAQGAGGSAIQQGLMSILQGALNK